MHTPRRGRLLALISLTLLATSTIAHAVESRSVRFQHLSRDDGLSQAFVYDIVQDPRGFMWFGTQEGLNRWDGYTFTVFAHDPADADSISDESIRTLLTSCTTRRTLIRLRTIGFASFMRIRMA